MVPDPQVLPLVPDCVAGGDVLVGGKVSLALGWGAKEAEAQSVGCVTPGAPAQEYLGEGGRGQRRECVILALARH